MSATHSRKISQRVANLYSDKEIWRSGIVVLSKNSPVGFYIKVHGRYYR